MVSFSYKSYQLSVRTASKGYIDLQGEEYKEKLIRLDGQWEFYPGIQESEAHFIPKSYVDVPGHWRNIRFEDGKMKKYGCATYRLNIKLPASGEYYLSTKFISSAYRIVVNGKEVGKNGTMGHSKADEKASWRPQIVPFYATSPDVELLIQVSNYHCYNGGITSSVLLGQHEGMYDYQVLSIIKGTILIGTFLGIGFYLTLLNKSICKNYMSLYLGVFCISSLIIEAIIDCSIIFYIFPKLSVEMTIKLEYLAYMGQLIAMQGFMWCIYLRMQKTTYFKVMRIINFAYTLIIVFTPSDVFGYNDLIYMIIFVMNTLCYGRTLVKIIKERKKYAFVLFIGICVMWLGSILEILNIQCYFKHAFLISNNFYIWGVLVFLLCQSYVLAMDVEETFASAKQAKDMEIAFLQAQISPHFFYNTLNNIYYLMDQNISMAKTLLVNFCNFLHVKFKFDYTEAVFCSLKEELELVQAYVEIENIRLNHLLQLKVEVDETLLQMPLLPLILQPLIENAIKHGFCGAMMKLHIQVFQKGEEVCFIVSDNGRGMGKDRVLQVLQEKTSSSIGLKNINYRLIKTYQRQLTITSMIGQGTQIAFSIPREV